MSRELWPVAVGSFSFSEHCEAEGWGGFLSQSCLESSERLGSCVKFFHLEIRNLSLRVKEGREGSWSAGEPRWKRLAQRSPPGP